MFWLIDLDRLVLVLEQLTMFHLFMAAAERRALSFQSRLQEPGEAGSAVVHPEVPSNQDTREKIKGLENGFVSMVPDRSGHCS